MKLRDNSALLVGSWLTETCKTYSVVLKMSCLVKYVHIKVD